jgi:hypothetical protein
MWIHGAYWRDAALVGSAAPCTHIGCAGAISIKTGLLWSKTKEPSRSS